jgi:hypothetical protein
MCLGISGLCHVTLAIQNPNPSYPHTFFSHQSHRAFKSIAQSSPLNRSIPSKTQSNPSRNSFNNTVKYRTVAAAQPQLQLRQVSPSTLILVRPDLPT